MLPAEANAAAVNIDARIVSFGDTADGTTTRAVPIEAPIAFEYDGLGYAVMMATPADLLDFAVGFTLYEQLAATANDIASIDIAAVARGWIVRIALRGVSRARLQDRVRLRLAEGSCGLCGLESIEQVIRPLASIQTALAVHRSAIDRALGALKAQQPLGRATGAAHAAAFCSADGALLMVREDVGRHNAMDKLLGGLANARIDVKSGFILLTARCSYELVEKAVLAGCPVLVTISAPTSLAVERAREHGLTLIALARADSMLVVNEPRSAIL